MKTIGLIGGITWYSTLEYYRVLNEEVNKRMGASHSARVIIHSVDFAEIKALTEQQDWAGIAAIMCREAKKMEASGASCILIGANTMHKIADEIQASIKIPVIHIADAVAKSIEKKQLKKVALLGTKYTMQMDFYKNKLAHTIFNVSFLLKQELNILTRLSIMSWLKASSYPKQKNSFCKSLMNWRSRAQKGLF
jgi:aspartate racemase